MRNASYAILTALLLLMLDPSLAHAYIGPGAGLSALGSLLSLLAAIGLGIVGFVWYPVRRLIRRFQSRKPDANKAAE